MQFIQDLIQTFRGNPEYASEPVFLPEPPVPVSEIIAAHDAIKHARKAVAEAIAAADYRREMAHEQIYGLQTAIVELAGQAQQNQEIAGNMVDMLASLDFMLYGPAEEEAEALSYSDPDTAAEVDEILSMAYPDYSDDEHDYEMMAACSEHRNCDTEEPWDIPEVEYMTEEDFKMPEDLDI